MIRRVKDFITLFNATTAIGERLSLAPPAGAGVRRSNPSANEEIASLSLATTGGKRFAMANLTTLNKIHEIMGTIRAK